MGNCRCYSCISVNGNFLIVRFFNENRIYFRKSKNRKKKIDPKKVFNGEFWTGEQAKKLGLIDSNEELNSYIEKHYGKKLKIRNIEEKKSFIKNILNNQISNIDIVDRLTEALRENSFWSRYGL